jgi:hypothetical protein
MTRTGVSAAGYRNCRKTSTLPFDGECFAVAAKVESERVEVMPDTPASGHTARRRKAGRGDWQQRAGLLCPPRWPQEMSLILNQ